MKTCNKCGNEYPATTEYFYAKKTGKHGLSARCHECIREMQRHYNIAAKGQAKRWRAENREHRTQLRREWRAANQERDSQYQKAYRAANPEKIQAWRRKAYDKRRANPSLKLSDRMKNAIGKSLRGGKAGRSWESIVGYTVDDLKTHLESQFTKGMTWDNYGSKWHIDHIRPISDFNFASAEDPEFLECWSLWNLQPLLSNRNLQKGAKCDKPPLPLIHSNERLENGKLGVVT